MDMVEVLRSARRRIEDPAKWTQHTYARRSDGEPTKSRDPKAVCWCAVGAVIAEGPRGWDGEGLLNKAALKLFNRDYASAVNDILGHTAVLEMYDAAIAAAEAEAR